MASTFAITLVLQVAVPVVLLAWQAFGRDTHIISWSLKHVAVLSYVYATSIAGLWLFVPWYVPHVLMVISISLAARTLPGAFRLWRPPDTYRQWLALSARGGLAVAGAGTLWLAVQGGTPPAGTVIDLAFPLKSGHYYIANGGSTALVNAHVALLSSDRARAYRGASYAVDILALDIFGNRASGVAPRDAVHYAIFGDAIYAPCEGVVIRVEDWLPDLAPPQVDRAHMAGNFVMLECGDAGDVHVLLGHMRSGSVRVHPGDYVTTDNQLGEVGNSGNSDEPHLHIHAQRPGHIWDMFSGDPLTIRFDGRYLVRNDRVTLRGAGRDIIDDD
jgi:Peptidase family M23